MTEEKLVECQFCGELIRGLQLKRHYENCDKRALYDDFESDCGSNRVLYNLNPISVTTERDWVKLHRAEELFGYSKKPSLDDYDLDLGGLAKRGLK